MVLFVFRNTVMTGNVYIGLMVAAIARLCLVAYGVWQDKTMVVKFTDVDYNVFTDAARHVTKGQSPYARATYRYTPLLAMVLTPNITLTPHFGKLLFILFDVLAGYLVYLNVSRAGHPARTATRCSYLWLLNPLPMAVAARGNAESFMAVLVLFTIYCLQRGGKGWTTVGYVAYALSVHVKIYPVTYALPLYLGLTSRGGWRPLGLDILPNWKRVAFVLVAGLTFVLLTGGCYTLYGSKYVEEAYLYHVTRRDTRHNFSAYFYLLYLLGETRFSQIVGLLVFIPQMVLIVVSSFRYHSDLALCCFLNTFIFVTFNKVCTSQYFLWYLCVLPVIVPTIKMPPQKAALLVVLWFATQGLWLMTAYNLEFVGRNTFSLIWLAGLVFFTSNVYTINTLLAHYVPAGRKVAPLPVSPPPLVPLQLARRPIRQKVD